jgi:acetyl esterase/lipase
MKTALQAAGKTAEFKIYPGAPHRFQPTTGRASAGIVRGWNGASILPPRPKTA